MKMKHRLILHLILGLALALAGMTSCHRSGKEPETPKSTKHEQQSQEPISDSVFDIAKMKLDYENYCAQGVQRDSVSFPSDCERLLTYWKQPCLVLAPDVEHYLDSIAEITGIPTYNNNDGAMAVRHAVHELHRFQTGDRVYYPVQEVKEAFDAMSQGFALSCDDADDGLRYIGVYYWFCFASQTALLCPVLDYISETHSPDNLVGLRSVCRCQGKMISAIINKRDEHCTVQMSGLNMDLRKVFQIKGHWSEDYYLLTSEDYANRSAVCLYERRYEELFLVVKTRIPLRKMRNGIDVGDDPVVIYIPWEHRWYLCVKVDENWQQIRGTKSLYLQLDAVTPYFEVQ